MCSHSAVSPTSHLKPHLFEPEPLFPVAAEQDELALVAYAFQQGMKAASVGQCVPGRPRQAVEPAQVGRPKLRPLSFCQLPVCFHQRSMDFFQQGLPVYVPARNFFQRNGLRRKVFLVYIDADAADAPVNPLA